MTAASRQARRGAAVFAAALIAALLAAVFQGLVDYRDRTPAPAVQARVGEPVQLGGTRLTVRSFTVADELPADDPKRTGKAPVRGPAGSVLVLIVYTQEVDATVDLGDHGCDVSLVAADGTMWEEDDDFGYQLRRPEIITCGSTDDHPVKVGEAREIGANYLIPAEYADQVRWRLSIPDAQLTDEHRSVEFRR